MEAEVRGTRRYTVNIWEESPGDIFTDCTCPYDWVDECKHVVATLFAMMNQQSTEPAIKEKKISSWLKTIKKLSPAESYLNSSASNQKPWRLAYTLKVNGSYRYLVPLRIRLMKDGSDGQVTELKQYEIYDGIHFDLTDRSIISNIGTGFSSYVSEDLQYEEEQNYYGGL